MQHRHVFLALAGLGALAMATPAAADSSRTPAIHEGPRTSIQAYGQQNPQNLQFYSSSFSNQPVSGHSTPFQAGYGASQAPAYPTQYGAGFSAPGVSGQMGVGASGLRTGWLAAFGTEG